MIKNKQQYYRVDFEVVDYECIYVKANSKKSAIRKGEKKIYGEVINVGAEKVTKKEYEANK